MHYIPYDCFHQVQNDYNTEFNIFIFNSKNRLQLPSCAAEPSAFEVLGGERAPRTVWSKMAARRQATQLLETNIDE